MRIIAFTDIWYAPDTRQSTNETHPISKDQQEAGSEAELIEPPMDDDESFDLLEPPAVPGPVPVEAAEPPAE